MPWIHLQDEVRAIVHCLENDLAGPVNLVAPGAVTNREFTQAVGRVLKRPTIFPAPAFALKLLLGEFAEEGLLASTRVVPRVLEETGFSFRHPTIEGALANLVDS
jgi:NAD dependent epimerase/dehydratase family enzyme